MASTAGQCSTTPDIFIWLVVCLQMPCNDILEGVLHYSTKEMLKNQIFEKKHFSLEELNRRISSFDYGYHDDSNKLATIQRNRICSDDHGLKQHGN